MAQVDVTELFTDPDFVDVMSIADRVSFVDSLGQNVLTEKVTTSVGSVQPASGRAIQRLPEALRVANMTSFWFKGLIVASSPGKYTSQLVFKGQRYNVVTVFDWTNFGQGWCEGLCVAEAPA